MLVASSGNEVPIATTVSPTTLGGTPIRSAADSAPITASLAPIRIDVSPNNDWSKVRVETNPGQYGQTYPVNGFILPASPGQDV